LVNGLALLLSVAGALGQGTFGNLDFESARIILDPTSPYYPGAVQASNAIPGWTLLGGDAYPDVLYNDVSLGAPAVSIHDSNDQEGFTPIAGRYSLYLQGFGTSIGVTQTGQIPAGATSLTFWSNTTDVGIQATFNGQVIPYTSISSGPNYTIYGGDISAFAGQTGALKFSGGGWLDNIQFNLPTPEPGVFGLSVLGALFLGWRVLMQRQ
jgi:hypothetical protein